MFGIGLPEFVVILCIAVVVIGPEDLPRLLYNDGKLFRKFKKLTADIQKSVDEIIQHEELEEITRTANKPGGENLQFEIERQLAEEEKRQPEKGTPHG